MYRDRSIGVVVLAYNEEEHIGGVLRAQPAFVDRIYVVDDCSTDGTWAEILAAAQADTERASVHEADGGRDSAVGATGVVHSCPGRIVPIRHHENRGPGGAAKTGYLQARADGMDVTVKIDGDGQMDPRNMTRVLDPIVEGRVEYAKGNRLRAASVRESMPTFRLAGNVLLTLLTRIASGYWGVSDPLNGYTAISHRALEGVQVETLYEEFGYHSELLARLNVASMAVADVTMNPVYGTEESSIEYTTFVPAASAMLLRTFLWRLREQYASASHPIGLGIALGSLAFVFGILEMAVAVRSRPSGSPRTSRGVSSNSHLAAFGALMVLAGLLGDMLSNDGDVVIVDE